MKKTLILLFSFSLLFACKSQTNEPLQKLDVAAFKIGITNPEAQLIDVRTLKEYNQGHIENATLIDFFSNDFKEKVQAFDKDKPLYLYCRSGGRSGKASKIILELGFKEIYDLQGGYMAWSSQ